MFVIGSHLSISKGYLHMGRKRAKIGAIRSNTLTRNPRLVVACELSMLRIWNSLSVYMERT